MSIKKVFGIGGMFLSCAALCFGVVRADSASVYVAGDRMVRYDRTSNSSANMDFASGAIFCGVAVTKWSGKSGGSAVMGGAASGSFYYTRTSGIYVSLGLDALVGKTTSKDLLSSKNTVSATVGGQIYKMAIAGRIGYAVGVDYSGQDSRMGYDSPVSMSVAPFMMVQFTQQKIENNKNDAFKQNVYLIDLNQSRVGAGLIAMIPKGNVTGSLALFGTANVLANSGVTMKYDGPGDSAVSFDSPDKTVIVESLMVRPAIGVEINIGVPLDSGLYFGARVKGEYTVHRALKYKDTDATGAKLAATVVARTEAAPSLIEGFAGIVIGYELR